MLLRLRRPLSARCCALCLSPPTPSTLPIYRRVYRELLPVSFLACPSAGVVRGGMMVVTRYDRVKMMVMMIDEMTYLTEL